MREEYLALKARQEQAFNARVQTERPVQLRGFSGLDTPVEVTGLVASVKSKVLAKKLKKLCPREPKNKQPKVKKPWFRKNERW